MKPKSVIGADPYILKDPKSGKFFCYATGGDDKAPFLVYQSEDLIHWDFIGNGLSREKNDWGKGWFWAPEVYYNPNNDHYYMFYSALVRDDLVGKYFGERDFIECCKIGVAVSKRPEGPFVNIEDHPIDYYPFDPNYRDIDRVTKEPFSKDAAEFDVNALPRGVYIPSIDADFFIDADQRMYLYYSRCCYRNCLLDRKLGKYIEESNILGVELEPDFWFDKAASTQPTVKKDYVGYGEDGRREDKFVQILSYHQEPQEWENGHVNDYETSHHEKHNRRWSEGSMTVPYVFEGKKKYLLFYSCNNYQNALYGVGVAFADVPMEHFKKYGKNPIIYQIPEMPLYSTGHGCVVEKDGQPYYFFHGRENCSEKRTCYLAKLHIESEDNIYVSDITHCVAE